MEINKIIDGYVINLEHDEERKKHIVQEFENSPINIKLFSAIKHKTGWIGCLRSHLELIKLAKDNNWNMILVIEDDAYIENKDMFNEIFMKVLDWLKTNMDKWKIFHGGPNINKFSNISNVHMQNPLLFDISKCVSCTFVIYNSNIFDFFLNFYDYPDHKLKSSNKIDMLIYNKLICTSIYPCLVWQINSYSNILQNSRTDLQQIKNNRDYLLNKKIKKI